MDDETISSSDLGRLLKALSIDESEDTSYSEHMGKIVQFDQNGLAWCQLDGAEDGELTPVENLTMTSKVGDTILVSIEDGVATGSPSTNNQMVTADYVNAVVSAMAGDSSALEEYLQHGNFEDITAQRATFGELDSDTAVIGNLTVDTANIANLEATNARFGNAIVNSLSAVIGKFDAIEATSAKMKGIVAEWIKAATLSVEKLIANEATIADLKAENATILNFIASDAYIGNLMANNAILQNLTASKADINLANIDIANIAAAKIQELMAGSGWFTQDLAVTGDSTITGQLKAVLIDGDTARFRNIYADALMIQGKNGLYHRLNFDGLDDSTYNFIEVDSDGTENPMEQNWYELLNGQYVRTTDEELEDGKTYYVPNGLVDQRAQALVDGYGDNLDVGLHGSHILAETITATQIDASSIRAALLEAAEVQVGSNAVSHIRMHEGMLGFYPGSTIVYRPVLEYEPVDLDQFDDPSTVNPSQKGWYVPFSGEYVLTEDVSIVSGTEYYRFDESYAYASPRSRRWYELDENIGYYRSVDADIDPTKVYYDGSEASVAYITNQELYIPRAVMTDKMAIGTPDQGQWLWEISDDQNLSLTWGGRYGGGAS